MAQSNSPPRRKPRFRERKSAQAEAHSAAPAQKILRPAGFPPPPTPVFSPRVTVRPRSLPVLHITVEQSLYGTILLAGLVLRLWDVGSRAMHGDEAIHAWFSWHLYNGTGYQYDPVYHGPLQFIVTAFFFFLFGVSDTTARLMAVFFGTALIGLPYLLRHYVGRVGALIASTLIAFSPAFVYVSRLERDDIFSSFFALLLAIALFAFVRTRRERYLYIGAASIALSLAAMENTYITLFVFGSYVAIVFVSEWLSRRPVGRVFERFWRATGTEGTVHASVLIAAAGVTALAFALTVVTGLYLPVPLVLALGIVALVNRQTVLHTADEDLTPFLSAFSSLTRQQWLNALTIVVAILLLTFSTMGTNLRGIWDSTQPLFNSGHACPGNPYPLNPCRKDIIGGLFYWLSQHRMHRGGQPWFYYSLLFGLYEQIAVFFGVGSLLWFLRRPTVFPSFLTYWAVLMFGIYSWAGEKFPWLIIHPLLPFLLLAAMGTAALLRASRPLKLSLLAALALLGILELHNMYEVNFVNGADPVEMMVYVQSSPDTPKVARDILSLSNKVTNGNALNVSIDALDTWPFAWYLRDMPNVLYPSYPDVSKKPYSTNPVIIVDESNQPSLASQVHHSYTGHRYRLRWWFPEDYKTLSWSSFARDAVDPGYWRVVSQWLVQRRPFGPKDAVWFYYYVKKGLVSPY